MLSSKIEENCNLQRVSKVCIRRSTDLFSSTFNFQSFKVSELIFNSMACAFTRELVSRVFCDKRMTSDRFYDPYIRFVFPSGLYLCVMRPNINTIETFESSRALTFSVISLEIVLHAYLFIGQGLRVYPKLLFSRCKHFFIVRWLNLSSAAKIILFACPPKCKILTRCNC